MTKHQGPYKFTVIHGESGSHGLIMADGPIQVAKLVEGTPADGLMMAAAPAMFEALQRAAVFIAENVSGKVAERLEVFEMAIAALAQAQGEDRK